MNIYIIENEEEKIIAGGMCNCYKNDREIRNNSVIKKQEPCRVRCCIFSPARKFAFPDAYSTDGGITKISCNDENTLAIVMKNMKIASSN